jgi:GT2 family glycosyltransferase/trans-aconitate methyltransferase
MKPVAIISLLWGAHFSALKAFLQVRGPLTILTVKSQISPALLDLAKESGSRVVALEELLTAADVDQAQRSAGDMLEGFSSYLDGTAWQAQFAAEDCAQLLPLIQRRLSADLPVTAVLLEALELAHERYQIDLLVVSEDVLLVGKTVTLWARAKAIASLQLAHSIALCDPYTVHAELHADVLAVYGQRGLEGYLDLGVAAERLRVTGNPAWDSYVALRGQRTQANASLRAKHGLHADVPIVVFGTTWAANLSALGNESIYGDSVLAFISACEQLRQAGMRFNAVIKDRPSNLSFGEQRCVQLIAELGADSENYFYSVEDTQLWAVAADVLVAVDSNYSVEAMQVGTPTINLLNAGGILLGPSFEAEAGILEAEAHELAEVMGRLLTDEPLRARQIEKMRLRAAHYNLGVDGNASQRVAQLMLELASGSGSQAKPYVWQEYLDVQHTEVEVEYHDTARSPLIDAFHEAPSFVLDIGCAAGANGQLLKQRFPQAKVWGIEINQAAAQQAAKKLDRVLIGKFETFDLEAEGIARGALDGVILADVLEHMYNPWSVLTALKPYLSPRAQIIISIPNVRNLRLMNALADGYWEYEPAGLLDITHIRFFTLTEFRRVLFETGYHVETTLYSLDAQLQSLYANNKDKNLVNLRAGRMTLHDVSQDELSELCSLQFIMRVGVGESANDLLGRYKSRGRGALSAPVTQAAALPAEDKLEQWLNLRSNSAGQDLKISQHLHLHAGGPALAVLILDLQGDESKLVASVQSIESRQAVGVAVTVIIFSTANLADLFQRTNLRFIRVSADEVVACINDVVRESEFDWLMLLDAGELFTHSGLTHVALELLASPACRAICADELSRLQDGTLGGVFRPSFNLDLLLSFPAAMARHWLFKRESFLSVGGFDSSFSQALELDLLLRLVEQGGLTGFAHVAEPLLITSAVQLLDNDHEKETILRHLHTRGYQAEVLSGLQGRYRISYQHQTQPLVSIIVPTKDQLPMLQRCVESLLEKTRYAHYELLIVDNHSETLEAREWLAAVEQMGEAKVRVLRYPHPFNYSAINNMAAREARGEYLVLLNNDTAIISENWLDELLNHAQRPEVGIVGAKLLYPDGRIQHAGVILGLRGPAEHPFIGEPMDAPGFMNRLQVDQNYSAVTAACLMIRKSLYEEVGGLDEENFKVSYNDVDLCLKVGDLGYLTVWTAHAVVMHEGSVSQKQVDPASLETKRKRFLAEQDAIYAKWLPQMANDPAYNANFALNGPAFTLEMHPELTWRPLSWRPLPVVLAHNADPWGCGHYRIIKPHKAMRDEGLIDGAVVDRLLEPAELLRLAPDVVVYQRQTKLESLENMQRSRKFSRAFKVYELDDYLPNTPIKSAHRSMMSKDLVKLLRKGLGYVDRFVVSTPALANALSDFHTDIRIAENRLPLDWWGQLALSANTSTKPRVGWAGGAGHQGDLELIADVVRDLADEVDWVFFGMCPDNLLPYVAESIPGIDIQLYPEKLAGLRLDLALAPLEDNLFNACKSNLRLIEYGICGYPVIASDIECYRGGLPVTLVKNRYRDWMEAIREHLADREALAARGLQLRAAVQRDWMLTGACLEVWRDAWLPD